jgi:hypothetical protein
MIWPRRSVFCVASSTSSPTRVSASSDSKRDMRMRRLRAACRMGTGCDTEPIRDTLRPMSTAGRRGSIADHRGAPAQASRRVNGDGPRLGAAQVGLDDGGDGPRALPLAAQGRRQRRHLGLEAHIHHGAAYGDDLPVEWSHGSPVLESLEHYQPPDWSIR